MATKTTKKLVANPKKVREDLHLKTVAELTAMAAELKLDVAKTQLMAKSGREKNTRSVFNKRKLLARVLSASREKMLETKA